ncbi:hypothetical protein D3C75_627010 [compost metagenome]
MAHPVIFIDDHNEIRGLLRQTSGEQIIIIRKIAAFSTGGLIGIRGEVQACCVDGNSSSTIGSENIHADLTAVRYAVQQGRIDAVQIIQIFFTQHIRVQDGVGSRIIRIDFTCIGKFCPLFVCLPGIF